MDTRLELEKKITYLINEFNSRNYELVIIQAKELIHNDFKFPIIYNLLGSSYSSINKNHDAVEAYKNAIKLDARNEE